jgi:hypothetical protein
MLWEFGWAHAKSAYIPRKVRTRRVILKKFCCITFVKVLILITVNIIWLFSVCGLTLKCAQHEQAIP